MHRSIPVSGMQTGWPPNHCRCGKRSQAWNAGKRKKLTISGIDEGRDEQLTFIGRLRKENSRAELHRRLVNINIAAGGCENLMRFFPHFHPFLCIILRGGYFTIDKDSIPMSTRRLTAFGLVVQLGHQLICTRGRSTHITDLFEHG